MANCRTYTWNLVHMSQIILHPTHFVLRVWRLECFLICVLKIRPLTPIYYTSLKVAQMSMRTQTDVTVCLSLFLWNQWKRYIPHGFDREIWKWCCEYFQSTNEIIKMFPNTPKHIAWLWRNSWCTVSIWSWIATVAQTNILDIHHSIDHAPKSSTMSVQIGSIVFHKNNEFTSGPNICGPKHILRITIT